MSTTSTAHHVTLTWDPDFNLLSFKLPRGGITWTDLRSIKNWIDVSLAHQRNPNVFVF